MGIAVRDVVFRALVLLQVLCSMHYCQGYSTYGNRRQLERLPERRSLSTAPNCTHGVVLRASLIHRDSLQIKGTNTSRGRGFMEAMKHSRRRVTQLQKTSLTSPLSPMGFEYFMQISFGTPPQQFTTLADTGSDLSWVQCSPCTNNNCKLSNNVFNADASSTYSQVLCTDPFCAIVGQESYQPSSCSMDGTCTYNDYLYAGGTSTGGDLAYDTVTLGGVSVPDIAFGCGTNQQGNFGDYFDGLTGLGRGSLSLPSQLSQHSVAEIFSYCLLDPASTSQRTYSNLTFGDAAEHSAATYTPMLQSNRFPFAYYVGVTAVSIGGKPVSIPASAFQINQKTGQGGVILDSGTTFTLWTSAAYTPIVQAFRKQIKYPVARLPASYGLCYDTGVSRKSSLSFPMMVVQMTSNVNLETPGSTLFQPVDVSGRYYCLMMGINSGFTIIGNVQQSNHLVVYDVVNQRVGFQAMDCSK
ncbi:hypothetical protein KC19_9G053300 [Ceratodon purpureus]|uniref:Peptidase A1 domain-containing protein n=1 Tax=Ceratodon purpureus TaxID=3225 RepID=A0A8T0GNZ0_CERPU|nr:hypothetical protein KC19_9G053300 [Ceratodon purpureus]